MSQPDDAEPLTTEWIEASCAHNLKFLNGTLHFDDFDGTILHVETRDGMFSAVAFSPLRTRGELRRLYEQLSGQPWPGKGE